MPTPKPRRKLSDVFPDVTISENVVTKNHIDNIRVYMKGIPPDYVVVAKVDVDTRDRGEGGYESYSYAGTAIEVMAVIYCKHSYGIPDQVMEDIEEDEVSVLDLYNSILECNGDGCDYIDKMVMIVSGNERQVL